ncbi:hypothetical protein GGH93_002836 [Coemansia aciculifera]|nr:hypothetical protein GGH93_002836 [Coemansia aciculifera]
MISQSLFLTLPMLVVEKIIEYLVGCPRNSLDKDIDKHNKKKKILYPLLTVGEIWCEAVLISIYDNCKVIFNDICGVFEVTYPA